MKKNSLVLSLVITLVIMVSGITEAQAKRFGGGSSFGSKPSYSQPYQAPSGGNAFSQPSRAPASPAAAANQTARQGLASRGGLMGMLGGLALGGLLGSMFFGGAFEHFNFMDFFLFAGIAYLVYRLFAARKLRPEQPIANAYGRNSYQDSAEHDFATDRGASGSARFNTDVLFNKGNKPTIVNVPAGFDQKNFLMGAEGAYRHLQAAWDNRDLASIRGLTTDKVFAEIQDQIRASNEMNKTEVLKLQAELVDVREVNAFLEATVLFDAYLSENNSPADQVREVWHFIKPINSQQTKWFLDGIQQVQL